MPDDSRDPSPHDDEAPEPLGPMTPDDETPAGDTPEVHGDITPHDLPPGSEARKAAEEEVGKDGTTSGNT